MANDDKVSARRLPARELRLVAHKEKGAGYFIRFHEHVGHELIYVDYGKVTLWTASSRMRLETGDCVVLASGTRHRFRGMKGKPFDFMNIVYRGRVPRLCREGKTRLEGEERRIMSELKNHSMLDGVEHAQMALLKLNELLTMLELRARRGSESCSLQTENAVRHESRIVANALVLLGDSYSAPLDVRQVAGRAGVSESHLRFLVRKETGRSLRQHLMHRRMEVARRLLRETGYNVTEISYKVGYQSPPHFSNVFRKVVGMSPREYALSLGRK